MKEFIKKLGKKIIHNNIFQSIIVWIVHTYILLVSYTSKFIIKGNLDELRKHKAKNGLTIFTWHGRIFLTPVIIEKVLGKNQKVSVLASGSKDGQIANKLSKSFGLKVIEGVNVRKTTKQFFIEDGVEHFENKKKEIELKNGKINIVIREIMKSILSKDLFLIAADAPKGPSFQLNTNILPIVKKTNTFITFVAISYKRKKKFNTWDKFELPFPFNKITVEFGKLYNIGDDIEALKIELTTKMNEIIIANDNI